MSAAAVLALGSNLSGADVGDPALGTSEQILAGAVRALAEHPRLELAAVSPVAVTAPVGGPPGQPDFLNMVVRVRTGLSPFGLLRCCQETEARFRRKRDGQRWGPRTLDVDVVVYGGLRMDEPDLVLPHPRAASRAFVLEPWARMDPHARLEDEDVAALAARAPDRDGIRRFLAPLGADLVVPAASSEAALSEGVQSAETLPSEEGETT